MFFVYAIQSGKKKEFALGNPIVWNAGWESTMQVKLQPPRMTGPGYCFDFKNSQPETRRGGLNGNSNNHEAGGFVGWENETTLRRVGSTGWKRPLEGAKRRYEAHFISKLRPSQSLSARNEFLRRRVRENFGNAGRIFTTGLKAVKIPPTSFRHGNPQC